jgi:hypothetical protein
MSPFTATGYFTGSGMLPFTATGIKHETFLFGIQLLGGLLPHSTTYALLLHVLRVSVFSRSEPLKPFRKTWTGTIQLWPHCTLCRIWLLARSEWESVLTRSPRNVATVDICRALQKLNESIISAAIYAYLLFVAKRENANAVFMFLTSYYLPNRL